jgi:adenylate cyclase
VLALLVAGLILGENMPPIRQLRLMGFDAYQVIWPRTRVLDPVVIVEIDDDSLAHHGQWPWPRTLLAQLVSRIAAAGPAAIGIDIFMPEPDRLSPGALLAVLPGLDRDLAERLSRLASNDTILARTLQGQPVVLAVAGLESAIDAATIARGPLAPMRIVGPDPIQYLKHWASLLRSVREIDDAAMGHGLISMNLDGGVVRRIPLIAVGGERLVPGLGPEMLRVASGTPALTVRVGAGVQAVGIGDLSIPTQGDGTVWIHFTRSDPARFVSATRVFAETVEPGRFERQLVLLGVTATGLGDYKATPVTDRMAGVEIHAQLLECIFDGALLSRPWFVRWIEAGALAASGVLLVWLVPLFRARKSTALLLVLIVAMVGLGVLLYLQSRILFDAASPLLGLGMLFTTMTSVTLAETENQRHALRLELIRRREAALRLAGELEAARRIQMGILPNPDVVFADEPRVRFYAFVEPAREVGGDLYDFFPLDEDRVFVLIGDVSDKGLGSSLFMAVSKSLCKSSALRHPGDIAMMMREANAEIARDNGEGLFVTAWAGIVNARTGELHYCNAGHEPPFLLGRAGLPPQRLADGGGPPLCVEENFPYEAASHRLSPGEGLCLITDGVTDAVNAAGDFYGRQRLEDLLARLAPSASPDEVGEAVRLDVDRFAAGVEASDDLAILAFQWRGVSGR